MKFEEIRNEACEANIELSKSGLIDLTFGNVGVFDKSEGVFAIKPSGVDYAKLTPESMVVVDLSGAVVDGKFRPSSDTPTYRVLFEKFGVRGVVHTHSKYAVSFAQAGMPIKAYGTTHADHFFGDVPITDPLSNERIAGDYEYETGLAIVEKFAELGITPEEMPAALVRSHGPFAWGNSGKSAVDYARALELCAMMCLNTKLLNPHADSIQPELLKKHFWRKHGKDAYYGQA